MLFCTVIWLWILLVPPKYMETHVISGFSSLVIRGFHLYYHLHLLWDEYSGTKWSFLPAAHQRPRVHTRPVPYVITNTELKSSDGSDCSCPSCRWYATWPSMWVSALSLSPVCFRWWKKRSLSTRNKMDGFPTWRVFKAVLLHNQWRKENVMLCVHLEHPDAKDLLASLKRPLSVVRLYFTGGDKVMKKWWSFMETHQSLQPIH